LSRIKWGLQHRRHAGSETAEDRCIPTGGDADWQVAWERFTVEKDPSDLVGDEWLVTLRRLGDPIENASIALTFDFAAWSTAHFVLLPAAAYAGNRFEARMIPYPPVLPDALRLARDAAPIVTDVPRLNAGAGESSLVQLTRDCATPLAGVWDPQTKRSFFLLCPAATRFGDSGFEIAEAADRCSARLALRVPGIRPKHRYSFCSTTGVPSPDRGVGIPTGLNLTIRVRVHAGHCAGIREFYRQFFQLRSAFSGPRILDHELPFSAAWEILEEKYNRENWYPDGGYYRVGSYADHPSIYQDWQTGWVGGLQFTLPQLALGDATTRQRATATLDFALSRLVSPSGYLWGGWSAGRVFGDNFNDTSLPWVLSRKNGDALYFLLKQFALMQLQQPGWTPPPHWENAVRGLADAFCATWERERQFGQFINVESGRIVVGGSAAAGIVPGALALAAEWFGEPRYLEAATASGWALLRDVADNGYTHGGPGEILQCPDSESAFGLLESCVVLHEATGHDSWLRDAAFMANQCASWCVNYDYPFPAESEFGRLGLRSRGSVWASIQNKHSAPGICTFSGDSLFKLFRATGETRYLDMIRETAHNITQYLSRPDRPIRGFKVTDVGNYATMWNAPAGWMSERVQLSDFSEPTGEIFAGSCWCETSCMLTAWEIPGIYLQPDTGLAVAFDHVDLQVIERRPHSLSLRIGNPTRFRATLRVLSESRSQARRPLGQNALFACPALRLEPGEWVTQTYAVD
jgi:hypothetical protein